MICTILLYRHQTKARKAVGGLIIANTLLSFPLPLVPVFRAFDCTMAPAQKKPRLDGLGHETSPLLTAASTASQPSSTKAWKAAKRTLVVLFCGGCAFAVPSFAVAMGFMGSITLSFLTFIFPATFYLKLHGGNASVMVRFACIFVICFGVLGGTAGIASNIAIAANYTADSSSA